MELRSLLLEQWTSEHTLITGVLRSENHCLHHHCHCTASLTTQEALGWTLERECSKPNRTTNRFTNSIKEAGIWLLSHFCSHIPERAEFMFSTIATREFGEYSLWPPSLCNVGRHKRSSMLIASRLDAPQRAWTSVIT